MNEKAKESLPTVIERSDYGVVEYSVEQVAAQVQKIQQSMGAYMVEGEHYGVVAGGKGRKPSLWKAGAEKLALMFRLDPEYTTIEAIDSSDFIKYVINCTLYHIPSGRRVASGLGSCNTHEIKYRYRWIEREKPGDDDIIERMKNDGTGKFRQYGSKWVWLERTDNPDPRDLDNTILKMACKRALVAAVLNATAASDIFTQDLEDMSKQALGIRDDEAADGTVTGRRPMIQPDAKKSTGKKYRPPKGKKMSDRIDQQTYETLLARTMARDVSEIANGDSLEERFDSFVLATLDKSHDDLIYEDVPVLVEALKLYPER